MRKTLLILSSFLLGSAMLAAAPRITGEILNFTSRTTHGSEIRIDIPDMQFEIIETPGGQFTKVRMDGIYRRETPGAPDVPVIRRLLRVSSDMQLSAELTDSAFRTVSLADMGLPTQIVPVQPSRRKSETGPLPFLPPDPEAYDDMSPHPRIVLNDLGLMRDRRIYRLDVYPVLQSAPDGRLTIAESIRIRLKAGPTQPDLSTRKTAPAFSKITADIPEAAASAPSLLPDSAPGYLIVTPGQFLAALQPFIRMKTEFGYRIETIVTENLPAQTAETIRDAVRTSYMNPADGSSPTFLLLVGDHTQLPGFIGKTDGHLTDLPYAALNDGDNLPDLYCGRISARNSEELTNHLNKIIRSERYLYDDDSHLTRPVLIAGWDPDYTSVYGYPAVRYAAEYYFTDGDGYSTDLFLSSRANQNKAGIIEALSTGTGFVNYTGHGSELSWADPRVDITDLGNLPVSGAVPLVITNGCSTSDFKTQTCFGEAWTRLADRGASAYIGGTNSTYWDEDLWWATGYYDIYSDGRTPTREETSEGIYDAAFLRSDLQNPSALIYAGNLTVTESGSWFDDYYWEVYELFGDPSMTLRTAPARTLAVTTASPIFTGSRGTMVLTDGGPDCLASLTAGDSLIASAYTDAAGTAELSFEPLTISGPLLLTVTGPGFRPSQTETEILVPSDVTMVPDTLQIGTSDTISVEIRDSEGFPAKNLMVWLAAPGTVSDTVFSDSLGRAVLNISAACGPSTILYAVDTASGVPMARDTLTVTGGTDFLNPQFELISDYIPGDTLSPGIPAVITGRAETDVIISTDNPRGYFLPGADSITVIPERREFLTAALYAPGYNTQYKTYPVVTLFTGFSGLVSDENRVPVPFASVSIRNGDTVLPIRADSSGFFQTAAPLLMQEYILHTTAFGFESADTSFIPAWPDDSVRITMQSSPRYPWHARIYDITRNPVEALWELYISDTDSLYLQGTAAVSDTSLAADLPPYLYTLKISAPGYVPEKITFHSTETPVLDVVMVEQNGILIIRDDAAKHFADKEAIRPIKQTSDQSAPSAPFIYELLSNAGLAPEIQDAAATNPDTWKNYNGIIYAHGDNQTPVSSLMQEASRNYLAAGGRILFEGGELAYRHYEDDFGIDILHAGNWLSDESGDVILTPEGRTFLNSAFTLPDTFANTYTAYGDEDAFVPVGGNTIRFAGWSDYPLGAAIAAVPDSLIFASFSFARINDRNTAQSLLMNCVSYLNFINPLSSYRPVTINLEQSAESDSAIQVNLAGLAWDPDGDSLQFTLTPRAGFQGSTELSNESLLTYTAPATAGISDTLACEVSDGNQTAAFQIIFHITGNRPPVEPELLAPADGYVNRDSSSVILRWAHIDDPDGDTVNYFVSLSQAGGPVSSDTLFALNDTLLRVRPADLGFAADIPVAWNVRAYDGRDTSALGAIRSFTIDASVYTGIGTSLLPETFAAGPGYPNPFNPVTSIPLALPEADRVTIVIYDIRGAAVRREILNLRAGYHEWAWNGRTKNGAAAGSGIYIVRIVTDRGHLANLKLSLIK